MIEVFFHKDRQPAAKRCDGVNAAQREHSPHVGLPLELDALRELLQVRPRINDVLREDVGIEPHQVFGEIDEEQRADANGDSRAGTANDR